MWFSISCSPVWIHMRVRTPLHCACRWIRFHLFQPVIPHTGSCFKFLPMCGASWHLWASTAELGAASFQISWQSFFPTLNGFVALSWPVPRWQTPGFTSHGVYKEQEAVPPGLGLGIQLKCHLWDDGEVTGHDTLHVLRCTWYDGWCFLGSCWSPAFLQCQRTGTWTGTGQRTSEQDKLGHGRTGPWLAPGRAAGKSVG